MCLVLNKKLVHFQILVDHKHLHIYQKQNGQLMIAGYGNDQLSKQFQKNWKCDGRDFTLFFSEISYSLWINVWNSRRKQNKSLKQQSTVLKGTDITDGHDPVQTRFSIPSLSFTTDKYSFDSETHTEKYFYDYSSPIRNETLLLVNAPCASSPKTLNFMSFISSNTLKHSKTSCYSWHTLDI